MRVLVVEDDRLLAETVARGLRQSALAVDVVHDGDQALERVSVTSYDVVILDRDLPEVHGDDVCRAIVDQWGGRAHHPRRREPHSVQDRLLRHDRAVVRRFGKIVVKERGGRAVAGPTWLHWVLTAVFALLAGYRLAHVILARRAAGKHYIGRSVDLTHLLVAAGMAAMFSPLGNPVPAGVWVAVFALQGVWFVALLLHAHGGLGGRAGQHQPGASQYLHHLIENSVMAYAFAAMSIGDAPAKSTAGNTMPGMDMSGGQMPPSVPAGAGMSWLPWLLTTYFLLHALWSGFRVVTATRAAAGAPLGSPAALTGTHLLLGPRLLGSCEVVMGLGMSYMFVSMLA